MITVHFPTGKRARVKRAVSLVFHDGRCELRDDGNDVVAVVHAYSGLVFETDASLTLDNHQSKTGGAK